MDKNLRDQCINTLRFLAVDAIEKANSGHPGMPLGAAAMAFVVWHDYLRFDPKTPDWFGRDRFVLSSGHASGLLYALLHCAGTGLSIDDLKSFRQWDSLTPGHPEYGLTAGVETTTGPLGQGFATGVGMALAAKVIAARFGTQGEKLFGQKILGIVSDGDLHEGISHESAALAGHWGLDNLIYLYDSNGITIEGDTNLCMNEDVAQRFEAQKWFVQTIDGLDPDQIKEAISKAYADTGRPSLIICETQIGFGSPKEGSASCHGSPLGKEAVEATRTKFGWPAETFFVPDEVRGVWAAWAEKNESIRKDWDKELEEWKKQDPEAAGLWTSMAQGKLPENLLEQLIEAAGKDKGATRALSGKVLQKVASLIPTVIGGSADLAPSNKTSIQGEAALCVEEAKFNGRNIHFGIREHAMAAICNGMSLHGPWRPYCGTFLVFTDYMRPSMRLAAMMEQPVIYIMTHDSYAVGEDGPTHQPVEHVWTLRMMPRIRVFRPADGVEVAAAWTSALESTKVPHVLALSRQGLPPLDRPDTFEPGQIMRGAYTLSKEKGDRPDVIIVATGSEVSIAVDAKSKLTSKGIDVRVVSMPCVELFEAQDSAYREEILPSGIPTVAMEAGISTPWKSVVGLNSLVIGLDDFGASAPASVLNEKFGFTADQVAAKISDFL